MTLPAHRFREERRVDFEEMSDEKGLMVPRLDIWKHNDSDKDYQQAARYLDIVAPEITTATIAALKDTDEEQFRADDLLRAARLEPANWTDPLFLNHLYRLLDGKKFRPIMIASVNGAFEVVDGFHRLSIGYRLHAQLLIPVLRA